MPKELTGRPGYQKGSAQGPERVPDPVEGHGGETREEEVGGDSEMRHSICALQAEAVPSTLAGNTGNVQICGESLVSLFEPN